MKSTLQFIEPNSASVSNAAKKAAARLEVLDRIKKLTIQHQYDYALCGLCLRSHQYTILDSRRRILFTAIQQLYRFGASNYSIGSRIPLLIYHYSHDPILEMHFASPALFEFTPSRVAVTLPSEVLIGSLKKEEKTAKTVLGESSTTIQGYDADGKLIFTISPGGTTTAGDILNHVTLGGSQNEVAKIRSGQGYSALKFVNEVEVAVPVDVKSLLLAAAIWMEIIERTKPRWRQRKTRC